MSSKRSSARKSAEIIGSNDDLMQEIFIFLPAKSLIRFRSACKQWRSLISSASFSRLHTLHHRRRQQPLPFFLLYEQSEIYRCHPTSKNLVPTPFLSHGKFAEFAINHILQSCNGLLLIKSWNSPHRGKVFYFVYNPTTMQSRELCVQKDHSRCLYIVFDPSISPHYKVLRFTGHKSRFVDVYDSETNSWTTQRQMSTGPNYMYGWQSGGVYVNGRVYFIRYTAQCYCFILGKDFKEIGKVPRIEGQKYVMESNGHLHYVVLSWNRRMGFFVRVFEMNQEDYVWFEKYRVDLGPIIVNDGLWNRVDVVGVIRGEKEEDSMMLLRLPRKLIIYRILNKTFLVLAEYPRKTSYNYCEVVHTLAPV